jgi:Domain of unknown function (DUF362)
LALGDSRDVIRNGSWYGNSTIWRMILDLNKVLLYANPDGTLRPDRADQRKSYITVVDAVISGEGNGPEAPDPKRTGLLLAGTNPASVDSVCARLMGFDWQKVPSIKNAFEISRYPICDFNYRDIRVVSSAPENSGMLVDLSSGNHSAFRPHLGWKNYVEL